MTEENKVLSDLHSRRQSASRKGYRIVFLLAFAAALMAEALLFMRAQMNEISGMLQEDFVIVAVRDAQVKDTPEAISAALKAVKGTTDVLFVGRDERLRKLKEEDPELVNAVLPMGANPMPDTFEIRVDEAALGNIRSWLTEAAKVRGVADMKYKPLEAYAILHSIFYGHIIMLSLALAFLGLVIMSVMTITYRHTFHSIAENAVRDRNWFFFGAAGGAVSVAISYMLAYPVKYLSPLWVWPEPGLQFALVFCCGVAGWTVYQWKNPR